MKKPLIEYVVDVDFYSIEYRVKARSAADARKKVKARIKKGVQLKNINHLYVDKL